MESICEECQHFAKVVFIKKEPFEKFTQEECLKKVIKSKDYEQGVEVSICTQYTKKHVYTPKPTPIHKKDL